MSTVLRRAVAASIPVVLLAGSTVASSAGPIMRVPAGSSASINVRGAAIPFASSTVLYAGGATLPVIAYVGKPLSSGTSSLPVAGSGSIFAYFETQSYGAPVSYCATGSGKGKGVIDGPAGTVSNPCANAAAGSTGPVGFNPGSSALTAYPALAGTDSPLSQKDYDTFRANAGYRVEPTQVPSIIGSVGIYYNNSNIPASIQARLTTAQLCGIVAGAITNWNQLGFPSKTIKLVYRADGSGTTFSFSNHLSASSASGTCRTLNASQQFAPTATVTTGTVVKSPPPNSIGATGNGGVAATVSANDGAIGYVETANALASGITNTKRLARVDGKDPIADLPRAANAIPATALLTDRAIVSGNGPATTAPLAGVPKAGCVRVVDPSKYATPSVGYPIIAVTNFLFNEAGNNTNRPGSVSELRGLVSVVASTSSFGSGRITKVDPLNATTGRTGYSELPTSFSAPLKATAAGCIN